MKGMNDVGRCVHTCARAIQHHTHGKHNDTINQANIWPEAHGKL